MRSNALTGTDLGLVNWPTPSLMCHDTGEGGLFAFAMWPYDDAWERCVVDTVPLLRMWDVLAGVVGPMADDLHAVTHEWFAMADRNNWENRTPEQAVDMALIGVNLGASVFLGSTPHSLFVEDGDIGSDYFRVTKETLTEKGFYLTHALEQVYGTATYATFLDT